ncbi:hypothetical protein [Streptomyces angustmyceticus]|uniref:hypothetical protein n=1 Tax=Streptomyces angustmyceticus TaxID=285578 RepID=UPI00344CB5E9
MGRRMNPGGAAKTAGGPTTIAQLARELPVVKGPEGDAPALMQREQDMLARCEAGVGMLQLAFWLAGKALQVIRDAKLYRATHDTFEAYCLERWDIGKSYATRLIRTWQIAEALNELESNGTVPIGTMKKVAQTQLWELVPAADAWDAPSAAFVYRFVLEVYGPKLTAEVLAGAVEALNLERAFNKKAVSEQIAAHFAEQADKKSDEPDPIAVRVAKAVPDRWIRKLAKTDRDQAAAFLDRVQQQVDAYRAELLAPAELPEQKNASADRTETGATPVSAAP